jgi:hypothetical protein
MSLDDHGNHSRAELEMEIIEMLRRLKVAPIVVTRDDGGSSSLVQNHATFSGMAR